MKTGRCFYSGPVAKTRRAQPFLRALASRIQQAIVSFITERRRSSIRLDPRSRWKTVESVCRFMAEGRLPYTVGQSVTVDGGFVMPRF